VAGTSAQGNGKALGGQHHAADQEAQLRAPFEHVQLVHLPLDLPRTPGIPEDDVYIWEVILHAVGSPTELGEAAGACLLHPRVEGCDIAQDRQITKRLC
jgi:hypothetical protein